MLCFIGINLSLSKTTLTSVPIFSIKKRIIQLTVGSSVLST